MATSDNGVIGESSSPSTSTPDRTMPTKSKKQKKVKPPPDAPQPIPETKAFFLSQLTFEWLTPLLRVGYNRPLEQEDLYVLGNRYQSTSLSEVFEKHWDTEKKQQAKPSLFRALNRAFGARFWPAMILRLIGDIITVISPLLLNELVKFSTDSYYAHQRGDPLPDVGYGYAMATILFVLQVVGTLATHHYFYMAIRTGFSLRTALITAIYRKSLVLSARARQSITTGKIVNIMSTDTARLDNIAGYIQLLFTAPIQFLVALGLLIMVLGPSALVGFAVMILFGPIQTYAMKRLTRLRQTILPLTDKRVKLTQEVLQGVRVVKLFAWEDSFLSRLDGLRVPELYGVRKIMIIRSAISSVAQSIPTIASILAFIVYALVGNDLTPATVFSALALFNSVSVPLMVFPMVVAFYADGRVSLERIREFLLADELEDTIKYDDNATSALQINNASFIWETTPPVDEEAERKKKKALKKQMKKEKRKAKKNGNKKNGSDTDVNQQHTPINTPSQTDLSQTSVTGTPTESSITAAAAAVDKNSNSNDSTTAITPMLRANLRNININAPRGSLIAVVGAVGSGKSSLLNALVGEMKCVEGEVIFGGSVGYCPQTAWIQNATVRDNITFGKAFDEARYRSIVTDCALDRDLEILPDGDMTEIGERGINLSGGQKQRLNIARAVYFGADIILLDDPLSAVDAHVARHLFDHCIAGALADKTRILVTHQLHYLHRTDHIIYMVDGEIAEQGDYTTLMANNGAFTQLMNEYGSNDQDSDGDSSSDEDADGEKMQQQDDILVVSDKDIAGNGAAINAGAADNDESKAATKKGQALMTTEERAVGAVNGAVYSAYIRAGGGWFAAFLLLITVIITQLTRVGNNIWLSWWSSQTFDIPAGVYMGVYGAWGVGQVVSSVAYGVCLAYISAKASRTLHDVAIKHVFNSPMSFFDTTPLGRIINRFSKDIDAVDNLLIEAIRMMLGTLAMSISTFVMICVVFPIFLAPLVPLLILYYYAQLFYRSTSRELKRVDSVTRSPLFAHFNETLNGLATIRAYRVQQRFTSENERFMDVTNQPYYLSAIIQRWLGVRLETIANILTFFVSIFIIISRTSSNPGLVGLVMSYSLQVTGTLNWCVRQAAEVEVNMNAVERLKYYSEELEQEAPAVIEKARPDKEWPSTGNIDIANLHLAYRKGLPDVLHGISASIRGGEKIGIVGRTGAGKSSIMIALFRLVEASKGSINIDGVDIASIGLADLRSRMSIIPQDPTLFHGTVRSNLDPFNHHNDHDLWDALERSGMKEYIANQPDGLDAEITEGGENLSAGQRQLICLARAMLVNARIIIMDEATASVDMRTDALLQKAIREDFAGCTILTIAHRLNTVIDYDRIMVLDAGEVREFDSPRRLLENPDGIFYGMVAGTGPANAAYLTSLAK